MNNPRQAASMRYSGQCLVSAEVAALKIPRESPAIGETLSLIASAWAALGMSPIRFGAGCVVTKFSAERRDFVVKKSAFGRRFLPTAASDGKVNFVRRRIRSGGAVEISCLEVIRELSRYIDDDVNSELRAQIEAHFPKCAHCTAVYDGTRNVITLVGDGRTFELPVGFSRRLKNRLSQEGK
jgi:hypothetical protein